MTNEQIPGSKQNQVPKQEIPRKPSRETRVVLGSSEEFLEDLVGNERGLVETYGQFMNSFGEGFEIVLAEVIERREIDKDPLISDTVTNPRQEKVITLEELERVRNEALQQAEELMTVATRENSEEQNSSQLKNLFEKFKAELNLSNSLKKIKLAGKVCIWTVPVFLGGSRAFNRRKKQFASEQALFEMGFKRRFQLAIQALSLAVECLTTEEEFASHELSFFQLLRTVKRDKETGEISLIEGELEIQEGLPRGMSRARLLMDALKMAILDPNLRTQEEIYAVRKARFKALTAVCPNLIKSLAFRMAVVGTIGNLITDLNQADYLTEKWLINTSATLQLLWEISMDK